jgi:hypothetical protein
MGYEVYTNNFFTFTKITRKKWIFSDACMSNYIIPSTNILIDSLQSIHFAKFIYDQQELLRQLLSDISDYVVRYLRIQCVMQAPVILQAWL